MLFKVALLKFVYSEKATKFCKISTLLLSTPGTYIQTKVMWRFLKILWPSQNIWTLNSSCVLGRPQKLTVKILSIFVAFLENMNFMAIRFSEIPIIWKFFFRENCSSCIYKYDFKKPFTPLSFWKIKSWHVFCKKHKFARQKTPTRMAITLFFPVSKNEPARTSRPA